jgi:hypothetical protein
MRVVVMPDAESQLATRRAWWRENRPATKDLFDQELAVAIDRIANAPFTSKVFVERRGHPIRRRLLPKTRCHLYFEILEGQGEVQIVAAAGSRQRRAPRIRLQDGP